MCVCVYIYIHTHTHTYTHYAIYISVFSCNISFILFQLYISSIKHDLKLLINSGCTVWHHSVNRFRVWNTRVQNKRFTWASSQQPCGPETSLIIQKGWMILPIIYDYANSIILLAWCLINECFLLISLPQGGFTHPEGSGEEGEHWKHLYVWSASGGGSNTSDEMTFPYGALMGMIRSDGWLNGLVLLWQTMALIHSSHKIGAGKREQSCRLMIEILQNVRSQNACLVWGC